MRNILLFKNWDGLPVFMQEMIYHVHRDETEFRENYPSIITKYPLYLFHWSFECDTVKILKFRTPENLL